MPADTLKDGNEKEPKPEDLVAPDFRPPYSAEHLVSDGESWKSLSARYRLSAKFIIASNFKTDDPEEINWYLRHYVKCNKATADRYNWRFTKSARDGGGPRPGTIYILPNWFQIGIQARIFTRRFVNEFFTLASLDPCDVEDTNLHIRQGALHSSLTSASHFVEFMKAGGAPDVLAENWGYVLLHALQVFISNISGVAVGVFPQFQSIQPGYPFDGAMAKPFHLLAIAPDDAAEVVNARFFEQITTRSHLDGTATMIAIKSYGRWFEESFAEMRKNAVATSVRGGGQSDHMGIFRGKAAAFRGFLQNVEMK